MAASSPSTASPQRKKDPQPVGVHLGGVQTNPIRDVATGDADDGLSNGYSPVILRTTSAGVDEERPGIASQYDNLIERLHRLPATGATSARVR